MIQPEKKTLFRHIIQLKLYLQYYYFHLSSSFFFFTFLSHFNLSLFINNHLRLVRSSFAAHTLAQSSNSNQSPTHYYY